VPLSEFFTGYRQTARRGDEVIESIFVPTLRDNEFVEAYKQSRRREDDLATANAGLRVLLDANHRVVEASLVFGGVNKTVISAKQTEQALVGLAWDESVVNAALATLPKDVQMPLDAPGGMVEFRRTLTTTFFFKFYLTVLNRIKQGAVPARELSATERFHRPVSTATHLYEAPLVGEPGDTIGQPVPHLAAAKQVWTLSSEVCLVCFAEPDRLRVRRKQAKQTRCSLYLLLSLCN
jgi:xanthine dehydrogenase/oxidase